MKTYVKKMRMGMAEDPTKEARQQQQKGEQGEEGDGAMADDEDGVQR